MTEAEIRRAVIEEISRIAPESDPGSIDPQADIREAIDLDSMDVLNLVIALAKRLAVDIPEIDQRELLTLDDATSYLAAKLSERGSPAAG
jgi:acyl carrier protein